MNKYKKAAEDHMRSRYGEKFESFTPLDDQISVSNVIDMGDEYVRAITISPSRKEEK